MTAPRVAALAVWIATAAAVVAVLAAVRGADVFAWLGVVLALAVVASFIGQLVIGEQVGFVARLATVGSGAFVVVLIGGIVAVLGILAA